MPVETDYIFSIANDTLFGIVSKNALQIAIGMFPNEIGDAVVAIDEGNDEIKVTTPDVLDDALGVPILSSIVTAHDGIDILRRILWSRKVAGLEVEITSAEPAWEVIDGVRLTIGSFTGTPARVKMRISGEWRSERINSEVQIVETTSAGDEDKYATALVIPDTSGAWVKFEADTDVDLRSDILGNLYTILGRRAQNQAKTFIRYCNLSLIWV